MLRDCGFFGRILSVRGEFGYWVFEGDWGQPAQRPSWNYRKADGGGIILDMLCHWRYVLDNLFGEVKAVSCLGATHIPERVDEKGNTLHRRCGRRGLCDLRARGRRRRPHQFELGRARAPRRPRDLPGRRHAWLGRRRAAQVLHASTGSIRRSRCGIRTSRRPSTSSTNWEEVPDNWPAENGFKAQWEMFLRHVAEDAPWPYGLEDGAKGVQLAMLGLQSWKERRWLDVPGAGRSDDGDDQPPQCRPHASPPIA